MRRGCISLGNVDCSECHRTIPYPERYLIMEENKGQNFSLCMNCCQKRGLVRPGSAKDDADKLFDLSTD